MWDQGEFERLLVRWIVATDQPFEEVERVEFKELLEYTHREAIQFPSLSTVRRRIMKQGIDTVASIQQMVKVCTPRSWP